MRETGDYIAWNTAWAFLGFVLLGIIAGLIPVGEELLARGIDISRADDSSQTLAANDLTTAHQAQAADGAFEAGWRYTKDGWQNRTLWEKPAPVREPDLHPAIVAMFQLMFCLVVLIGFSASKQRLQTGK